METIRWGILGCGKIARKFAEGLKSTEGAELVGAGSRSVEKASAFSEEFSAQKSYGSYEELAADPEIDAIYVATPHPMHCDHTILCLEAGKAVLCEKPFAMNAREALLMVEVARREKRFLMEAMWTRFLPLHVRLKKSIDSGDIGELRMLQVDFGFRAGVDPESRLFDPALGGGALLDVGIYPISLASFIFGEQPAAVTGFSEIGSTGIDEQDVIAFSYLDGRLALISCAIRTQTPHEARIFGTDGYITIHRTWWRGNGGYTITPANGEARTVEVPMEGNGYNYEAAEVARCLREGAGESIYMPLDETVAIMRTMDTLRAHWGLRYPADSRRNHTPAGGIGRAGQAGRAE